MYIPVELDSIISKFSGILKTFTDKSVIVRVYIRFPPTHVPEPAFVSIVVSFTPLCMPASVIVIITTWPIPPLIFAIRPSIIRSVFIDTVSLSIY